MFLQPAPPAILALVFSVVSITGQAGGEHSSPSVSAKQAINENRDEFDESGGMPRFMRRIERAGPLESPNVKSCGIVASEQELMEGRLSDYWAQELIGADLLKELVGQAPLPQKPLFVAVFDGEEDHAENVSNLISGKGPYSVLPDLGKQIRAFETVTSSKIGRPAHHFLMGGRPPSYYRTEDLGEYHIASALIRGQGETPSFINNSMAWGGDYYPLAMFNLMNEQPINIYRAFQALSPQAVVVTAGGNDFPLTLSPIKSSASRDFHAVIVGSFSPWGFVSHFSQEGGELNILAPSDDYITSLDDGGLGLFGGTSGATALVTGALAGFEWLSGYHPDGAEAKILLEKTAILTLHSHERPQRNGTGLLNGYKLGMTALRLKEKCQTKDPLLF